MSPDVYGGDHITSNQVAKFTMPLQVLLVALFIHKVIEVKFAVFWKTFFIRLFGGTVGFVEGASAKLQMVYNRRK